MKKVQKRRRRENKTDYLHRMKLLKSGTPRVVFRKTNRFVITQYITSFEAKDKIEFGITSKKLLNYGWPKELTGSLKSISAAYLTGYLMGKTIAQKKVSTPIIDFGMNRTIYGTKIYGFLKGMIDSGITINCKNEAFPQEDRIQGKHMIEDFSKFFNEVKTKIDKEGAK